MDQKFHYDIAMPEIFRHRPARLLDGMHMTAM
jgi:hypothetical protein